MPHKHTATTESAAYPYRGPVCRPDDAGYNPAAHGGCAYQQTCACGAQRWRNVSAGEEEFGAWTTPDLDATLTLRITAAQRAALDANAKRSRQTRSEAARAALARGLDM